MSIKLPVDFEVNTNKLIDDSKKGAAKAGEQAGKAYVDSFNKESSKEKVGTPSGQKGETSAQKKAKKSISASEIARRESQSADSKITAIQNMASTAPALGEKLAPKEFTKSFLPLYQELDKAQAKMEEFSKLDNPMESVLKKSPEDMNAYTSEVDKSLESIGKSAEKTGSIVSSVWGKLMSSGPMTKAKNRFIIDNPNFAAAHNLSLPQQEQQKPKSAQLEKLESQLPKKEAQVSILKAQIAQAEQQLSSLIEKTEDIRVSGLSDEFKKTQEFLEDCVLDAKDLQEALKPENRQDFSQLKDELAGENRALMIEKARVKDKKLYNRSDIGADGKPKAGAKAMPMTSADVKAARANIETISARMQEINSQISMGKEEYDKETEAMQEHYSKLMSNIDQAKAKMATMKDDGTAYQTPAENPALAKSIGQTNTTSSKLDGLKAKLVEAQVAESQLRDKILDLKNAENEAGNGASAISNGVNKAANKSKSDIDSLKGRMANAFAGTKLGKLGGAVGNVAGAFGRFGNVVGSIGDAFKKLRGNAEGAMNSTKKSLGKGLKTLIKYVFGVRSIFFLYKKLRSAVAAAFTNMAAGNSDVNKQVNSLKGNLETMKNSLATMFQPLLSVIVPIFDRITDAVLKASSAIGSFFAGLTGQKYIIKATKNTSALGNATSGAADSANKAVASFDKLNVINKDSGSGSGSSGGGGFNKSEVDGGASEFGKALKDAWKNGDYEEIGRLVGQKIKDSLDSINWGPIQAKAKAIGTNFAKILNGYFEVPGLGYTIGNTVAQGLNTAIYLIEGFVKNLHFDSIGKHFGDRFNGIFMNIDYSAIFTTIGAGFNGIMDFIYNFFTTVKWHDIGSKIMSGLQDGINSIDFGKIAKAISSVFIGAFDFVSGLLDGIDFAELVMTLFNGIIRYIQNYDYKGVAKSMAHLLGSALRAVGGLLVGLGSIIAQIVMDIIDYFKKEISKQNTGNIGLDIILGIIKGIAKAHFKVLECIGNIVVSIIQGFCEGLGIHSPSKVMAEIGGYIMEGLINGIGGMLEAIKTKIGEIITAIITKITEIFDTIKEKGSTLITNFITGIGNKIAAVKNKVGELMTGLLSKITEKFETIKAKGSELFEKFKNGISNKVQSILDTASGIVLGILFKIAEQYENIKSVGSTLMTNLKDGIGNMLGSVKDTAGEIGNAIKNKLSGTSLLDIGKNLIQGFIDGIKSMASSVASVISHLADNSIVKTLKSVLGIHSPSRVAKEIGGYFSEGLSLGIEDEAQSVFSSVNAIATDLANTSLQTPDIAMGKVLPSSNDFVQTLNASISDVISLDNIENQLAGILQAIVSTSNSDGDTVVQIDGREVFRAVRNQNNDYIRRTGNSAFGY